MPLSKPRKPRTKARCRANVSRNVSTLMDEGYPQKQAVAIALDVARRGGCNLPDTRGRAAGRKNKSSTREDALAERLKAHKRYNEVVARIDEIRTFHDGYEGRFAGELGDLESEEHGLREYLEAEDSGHAAGKAPRPPKGTPTDLNLFALHNELQDHAARHGQPEPLFAFSPTRLAAMRRLLRAGYLAPALGGPQGHWVVTGQGLAALEGWRERNAGFYGIPQGYQRSGGEAGRDGGVSLVLVAAVVVGAILLLRPVFRDSFERHKWSMEHDPAYRRSHEAMEYAAGARGVVDILTNNGRASGRRAPRDKVIAALEAHFDKYKPYYRGVDREKMFMVAVEMLDQGASATDALALAHGLAHDHIAQKRTARSTPKATARAILSGKVKLCALPVNK